MDTVGAHLKGESEMVAYDESRGVVRAQRAQWRKSRNQSVYRLSGVVDAQDKTRNGTARKGGIQLLGQLRRLETGRADQQELAARLGRGDRLVQGASPKPLRLR